MILKESLETEHITLDIFDEDKDNIRISLFNESCHFIEDFYLSEFQAKELKELLNKVTFTEDGKDNCL